MSRALRRLLGAPAGRPLPEPRSRAEELAQALFLSALSGDVRAAGLIFDRVEGRVPQALRHEAAGTTGSLLPTVVVVGAPLGGPPPPDPMPELPAEILAIDEAEESLDWAKA